MAASTRWIVLAALAAGLTALAALGGSAEGKSKSSSAVRPNILVLMTDDQTVESMRVMPNVKTLIADQGVTFDNSFVSYSLCCPSRSTFLTGQYAHNHGVWGNAAPNGGYYKLDSTNTLPVWLQRAGYQTIHLGKYLNQYGTRNPREIPPGWGQWYGTPDPSTYRYLNYQINENGNLVQFGNTAADYKTDVESRLAVDLISHQAADPRPFFMWVAFLAPHSGGPRDADDPSGVSTPSPAPRDKNRFANEPLPRPASFNEADVSDKPAAIRNRALIAPARINAIRENYQQRLESLLAVDDAVAQIVNELARTGSSTTPTSSSPRTTASSRRAPHSAGEGRPLRTVDPRAAAHAWARDPGGQHRSQFVANIDLAPTIVQATGAQPGRVMDGRSLIPFAKDKLLQSGRDILLETPTYAGVRSPNWLYAEHVTGEKELYNLARDRDELNSLQTNPEYDRMEANLALRLARLRQCKGAVCRRGVQLSLGTRLQRSGRGCRASRSSRGSAVRRRDASRTRRSTWMGTCSSGIAAHRSRSSSRNDSPSPTGLCSRP